MEISNQEATELLKFLSNQFIDRNDNSRYDGQVIYEFMSRATEYLHDDRTHKVCVDENCTCECDFCVATRKERAK